MSNSQICINHCPEATNGEPCAHCVLVTAVEAPTQRDAQREDEAFEVQQTLNACRSIQLIKDLEQSIAKTDELTKLERSAMRTDLVLFFWVALILVVAVMWVFGQSSPVRMCGGV